MLESAPNAGSRFRLRLPNPILASSLRAHKTQKSLPRNWTFWMNQSKDEHGSEALYGAALQNMDIPLASSPSNATILVQPVASTSPSLESLSLGADQVLLMLGWEEDYHSGIQSPSDEERTVYGRLPWTRNRLIATLLQVQQVLASTSTVRCHVCPDALARKQLSRRSTNAVSFILARRNDSGL